MELDLATDWFVKGTQQHPLCEDYVACDSHDKFVLSDGCSSSPNTDIGARIVSHSMLKALKEGTVPELKDFGLSYRPESILKHVREFVSGLQLPQECLDATIISVFVHEQKKNIVNTFILGDGCIFARRRVDNALVVFLFECTHNAPYYWNYVGSDRDIVYKDMSKSAKYKISKIEKKTSIGSSLLSYEEISIPNQYELFFDLDEYYMVGACSDGIQQFIQDGKTLNWIDCLNELTSFTGPQGQFVKRRCIYQFKEWTKSKMLNYDDFSMAVILDRNWEKWVK